MIFIERDRHTRSTLKDLPCWGRGPKSKTKFQKLMSEKTRIKMFGYRIPSGVSAPPRDDAPASEKQHRLQMCSTDRDAALAAEMQR